MKTKPKYWWIIEIKRKISFPGENSSRLVSVFSNRKNLFLRFGKFIYAADQRIKDELISWQNKGGYHVTIHYCLGSEGRRMVTPVKKLQKILEDTTALVISRIEMEFLYQEALRESSTAGKKKAKRKK